MKTKSASGISETIRAESGGFYRDGYVVSVEEGAIACDCAKNVCARHAECRLRLARHRLAVDGLLLDTAGASGLVIIMIGATVISVPRCVAMAVIPFVTGVLAAFVAYGRWRLAPL